MIEVTTYHGPVFVNAWHIAAVEDVHSCDSEVRARITLKGGKEIDAYESYDWVQEHIDNEIDGWKAFKKGLQK